MSQIRLNAEGLSKAAMNLRNQGNDLESLIGQMQGVINSLPDSWEGAAANAYVEQFAGLKPGLDETRELVETIARQIEQTLAAAQELDTNIAGQFR
jgi:WXG100 family type VII secretion target